MIINNINVENILYMIIYIYFENYVSLRIMVSYHDCQSFLSD